MRKKLLRSCGCRMCRAGRGTVRGKYTLHVAEAKLRHNSKINIAKAIKACDLDLVDIVEVQTDYTD